MIMASLLATSAIVPALAASAEVGGDITRSGEAVTTSVEATPISAEEGIPVVVGTLSYTVEDPSGMIATYLGEEAPVVQVDGQNYLVIELPALAANIASSVTVNEENILEVSEDGVYLNIPLTEDLEPVTATVVTAFGTSMDVTLTPVEFTEAETGTDEEGTDEETDEDSEDSSDVAPLKYLTGEYGVIADGEYEGVEIDFVNLETEETGWDAMARHLQPTATLVVEDGEYFLDIQATEDSNSMIINYYLLDDPETTLESIEGSKDEYPHTVRVPLVDINGYTEMAVHVYAEIPGMPEPMDKPYPFGIMVKPGQALTELIDTYVYKDKSNELSIMNGKYLSDVSTVTLTEDGNYSIDVIFPQNQYVVDFIFDGKTVAASSTGEDENGNEVGIYTVEVEDLSKIYTATVDLNVQAGPVNYQEKYDVQIQFGGEKNPFGDIAKNWDWAYSHVVSLYNKGIFKAADKFNPGNNLERGHFALMLARAFDLEAPANTPFTDLRSDVEEQTAIKALNNYGIINGKSATTFAPADKILRYEAALMINRLLNKYDIEVNGENLRGFNDIDKVSNEANEAIVNLASLDIIGGKGDGKFDPNGTLTRAEMAKILDNALKLIEKQ